MVRTPSFTATVTYTMSLQSEQQYSTLEYYHTHFLFDLSWSSGQKFVTQNSAHAFVCVYRQCCNHPGWHNAKCYLKWQNFIWSLSLFFYILRLKGQFQADFLLSPPFHKWAPKGEWLWPFGRGALLKLFSYVVELIYSQLIFGSRRFGRGQFSLFSHLWTAGRWPIMYYY